MWFLDTNIFLRYILGDDPAKTAACRELFARLVQGKEEAGTSETVVAEIMYVLTSRRTYGLSAKEACGRIRPLLEIDGLRVQDKRACLFALDLFQEYPFLGFEDALFIAHIGIDGFDGIYSYDRGLVRIPGVTRAEPPPATP